MADKDKKKQKKTPEKKPAPAKKTEKTPAKKDGEPSPEKQDGESSPEKQDETASPAKQDGAKGEEKLPRKERKKREKELLKQQLELEKKLVEEGKIPARNKYKSNNFFWRVFAICLAFFFGLAGAIGGLVGFGVSASVHDVLGLAGIDTDRILYEEYARQSILDLVRDITSNSFDSLDSVSKYTPALDSYLEVFSDAFADLGAHLDLEQLKATKFADLGTFFKNDVLNSVVLGEVLELTPDSNELFLGLCYGAEGEDYTVQNGKIVMNEGKSALTIGDLLPPNDVQNIIGKITIEQALGVTAGSNAAMRYLAYGSEGTEYKIVDGKVVMLENELTGKPYLKKTLADLIPQEGSSSADEDLIENARISDLITVEGDAGILSAIKDWKISDLQDTYRLERIRIDQIMDIGNGSSSIARAIAGWRLGDLLDPARMDSLTLGDVLSIDDSSPLILRSLKDTSIGEFGNAIDGLRLSDILEEKDFAGNRFLSSLRSSTLTSLASDLKELSAAQVFGEEMYSYLDPDEQYEKKNYTALYEYYKETGHTLKDSGQYIPKPVSVTSGDQIISYYVHGAEETRLTGGYYTGVPGNYTAVPASDIYARLSADGRTTEYYMRSEQSLTPSYAWRFVDYKLKKLSPLPDGDSISTDPQGYTVVAHEGTPYTDGENRPYYYLTTRTAFLDGEPTADTERVAYPVLQNGTDIYYCYLKYTPGNDGSAKFGEERVDLEYSLAELSYESGSGTVTLTKNADGKWSYIADGGEAETVSVYEKPQAGSGGAVDYYMKTEVAVYYGYYAAGDAVQTVYGASDVTEKFVLKKADGSEKAVDRYLSGVWYFLFGTDGEGNLADSSDVPVLELDTKMSGMAKSLSDTELWQLYFHGLLTSDPYVQLTGNLLFPDGIDVGGGKKVTNLNECTVVECIKLVETLFNRMGGVG